MHFPSIDPVLLDLGIIKIHWYGVAYMVGILTCWKVSKNLLMRHHPTLPPTLIDDFVPYAVAGIILGGRLGHAVLYEQSLLLDPLKLIQVWHGGMAFHGGLVGYSIGLILYCRKQKVPLMIMADILAVAAPMALFLGRIANFINGELYGRVTDATIGMVFPHAGPLPRHPSQLYEAFAEGLLIFIILYATHARAIKYRGILSGLFLVIYALARSFCELYREPSDGIISIFNVTLTMGQLFTLPMILAGIGLIISSRQRHS